MEIKKEEGLVLVVGMPSGNTVVGIATAVYEKSVMLKYPMVFTVQEVQEPVLNPDKSQRYDEYGKPMTEKKQRFVMNPFGAWDMDLRSIKRPVTFFPEFVHEAAPWMVEGYLASLESIGVTDDERIRYVQEKQRKEAGSEPGRAEAATVEDSEEQLPRTEGDPLGSEP